MLKWSVLLLLFILASCHFFDKDKVAQTNVQLKDNIVSLSMQVDSVLQQLHQTANSINVQGRALSMEEIEFTARISTLNQQWENWQSNYTHFHQFTKEGLLEVKQQQQVLRQLHNQIYNLQVMTNELAKTL